MARSNWKFSFFSKSLWRKIFKTKFLKRTNYKNNFIKVYDRSSSIPSLFKLNTFRVHKGSSYRNLLITKLSVGMKFGEFAFTRKPFHFPLRKKKSRKFRR